MRSSRDSPISRERTPPQHAQLSMFTHLAAVSMSSCSNPPLECSYNLRAQQQPHPNVSLPDTHTLDPSLYPRGVGDSPEVSLPAPAHRPVVDYHSLAGSFSIPRLRPYVCSLCSRSDPSRITIRVSPIRWSLSIDGLCSVAIPAVNGERFPFTHIELVSILPLP